MEILLKTKQAGNDKFKFLDFGAELNDYYKFIKSSIKNGTYKINNVEVPSESESDSDSDGGGYLHPSLLAGRQQTKSATPPPVQEKPKMDENHPLYKIMRSRKEAEEQKKLEETRRARSSERSQLDKDNRPAS